MTTTGPTATDFDSCYAAVASRDRRFDGRFITGVLTTGIFCRPSCPARTPKRENVRFFPSAAAAQDAGLRACRRCRPELAPDRPEVDPQADVAARALRMIEDGAGEGGVPALAARLHVSPRHLQRITTATFGAGPAALITMRRVRLARMLVDQTDLPLTRVAFAAGFGSVRQFNDAFRRTFHASPTDVRRGRPAAPAAVRVTLAVRQPFAPDPTLEWVALHDIPGRTGLVDGAIRHVTDEQVVTLRPTAVDVVVEVVAADGHDPDLGRAVALARQVFDLDADVDAIDRALGDDALLGPLVARRPGLRIPGAADPWEGPVRTVLGQQVSAAAATTMMGRLAALSERPGIPSPGVVRDLPLEAAIGLTRQRAGAVRALAAAVDNGLDLAPGADPDTVRAALLALPGIGRWTASSIGLLTLRNPDAWPEGDLALRRAVEGLTATTVTARELDRMAERWRPWRGYAAMHLWTHYLSDTVTEEIQ
ncbi:Ada metal-binding domain-containing protein [Euzebya rosea]|uniref:Ada metal-binding domain-containing protein n=1 Tax=Euzebya rosea TaxID=2052804 RepID=UPI000D3E4331|nr:Ada metal-binding domain-containing protein [Euzebya rosea]